MPERIALPHPLRGNRAFGTICAVMIFLPCWGVLWVSQDRAVWLMGGTKEGSSVGGSAPAQGAKEAYGDDLMKERTMGRYAMRRLLVAVACCGVLAGATAFGAVMPQMPELACADAGGGATEAGAKVNTLVCLACTQKRKCGKTNLRSDGLWYHSRQ